MLGDISDEVRVTELPAEFSGNERRSMLAGWAMAPEDVVLMALFAYDVAA